MAQSIYIPDACSEIAIPFAHSTYTRSVLDFLNGRGIAPSKVLASAGLAWQDLSEGRFIDYSMFRRFVAQAIRCSGEPALGLLAGSLFQPYHSPVGLAAVTGESLGQGLCFLSRYARLLFGNVDFRLEHCTRWSTLEVKLARPLHETHDFIVQFVLGAHCRLLEAMRGRPVEELRVGLPFPCSVSHDSLRLPHVRSLEFDHPHLRLQMPIALTREPCVSANPMEYRDAAQVCRRMETELGQGEFARRVRHVLFERLVADPDSHELASKLGVSTQIMARRLAEVGTTYSHLKEGLRKAQASWYLRHTELSMEDIASQLGYAEQASFSRAFKRWFRVTPTFMRQHLRGGGPGEESQPQRQLLS